MKQENIIIPYKNGPLAKKTELTNVDVKDIFKMTPNQIFNIWKENEYKINKQISITESEILELKKRVGKIKNYQKMKSINYDIIQKQNSIITLRKTFQTWTKEIQNNINKSVRIIFSKLLLGVNNNELNKLVKQFGDVFARNENANESVESILIKFIEGYKDIGSRKYNEVEVLQNNRDKIRQRNTYEAVKNPVNFNNGSNDNMRFFNISISYGSSGNPNKSKHGNFGEGLQSMLLNAVDTLSNVLYGTIQESIEEINKKRQ